jgi:mRNA interferase MazF
LSTFEREQEGEVKRGEICWADLIPRSGSEQTGRRRVVVISHDAFNRIPSWTSIIVVPITTSTAQGKRGPTVVAHPNGASGLSKPSFAICHQVTTLDRAKLTKRLRVLVPRNLQDVEDGLKAALDLD